MERFAIKIDKNLRANLYKICRLCGIDNPDKIKVLDDATIVNLEEGEPELWKKVLDCIGLLITKDDKMPQFMCTLCVDKINDFFEFREMCYATDIQTRKLLGIKEEPKLKLQIKTTTSSVDCKVEAQDVKQQIPVVPAQKPGRKRRNADMEVCNAEIKSDDVKDIKPSTASTSLNTAKKKRLKLESTDTDTKPAIDEDARTGAISKSGLSRKRLKLEPTVKDKKQLNQEKVTKLIRSKLKVETPPATDDRRSTPLQLKKRKALELLKQRKLAKQVAVVKVEKLRKTSIDSKIKQETPHPTASGGLNQPKVKLKEACTICSDSFVNKTLLDKHIKSTHIPTVARYHCVRCNETLKKNMEIKNHNLWHKLSKTPFQCGNCSESSCSIYTYSKHIRDCSQISYIDAHTPDWHCPECEGVFETTYLFNIHSCVSNTLVCPGCDRSHKWKEDFFKHIPTCAAAVHRIPSYMTPNIQVKNEAEHPSSPIPQHHAHSLPSPAAVPPAQPSQQSRITPPLMDSNQCVVIPGNVSLLEEGPSSSPKGSCKKSKRITKKDLKRFDKLLKRTMTALVSIKQEPTQSEGALDVRASSESPSASPEPTDDHFHNDDDESGNEESFPQTVGTIKQEIVDEEYRDHYSNIEVNVKREAGDNETRNTEVKKRGDNPMGTSPPVDSQPPKPVLKLKITKEHGTLNSILLDSPKSEKKKKKKKRKEEKHREREEAYNIQRGSSNEKAATAAMENLDTEPIMPLPEIVSVKEEIPDAEEEKEQFSDDTGHCIPSIVAATSGSLQISCVSEGVNFNGADDNEDRTEEEPAENVLIDQGSGPTGTTDQFSELQEPVDIKPRLEDLIPTLQIASVSSGEDLMNQPLKKKRGRPPGSSKASTSTPKILSVSSGNDVVPFAPVSKDSDETCEKVDSNENIFDFSQVKIKEEIHDPAFDEKDNQKELDEEVTKREAEKAICDMQAEENAYIANIDFNNLSIKQEKEYIDDGLDNPLGFEDDDGTDSDTATSSDSDSEDSESEREYRELPSENEETDSKAMSIPVLPSMDFHISEVRSEFTCLQQNEKTESEKGAQRCSEDTTKSNTTTEKNVDIPDLNQEQSAEGDGSCGNKEENRTSSTSHDETVEEPLLSTHPSEDRFSLLNCESSLQTVSTEKENECVLREACTLPNDPSSPKVSTTIESSDHPLLNDVDCNITREVNDETIPKETVINSMSQRNDAEIKVDKCSTDQLEATFDSLNPNSSNMFAEKQDDLKPGDLSDLVQSDLLAMSITDHFNPTEINFTAMPVVNTQAEVIKEPAQGSVSGAADKDGSTSDQTSHCTLTQVVNAGSSTDESDTEKPTLEIETTEEFLAANVAESSGINLLDFPLSAVGEETLRDVNEPQCSASDSICQPTPSSVNDSCLEPSTSKGYATCDTLSSTTDSHSSPSKMFYNTSETFLRTSESPVQSIVGSQDLRLNAESSQATEEHLPDVNAIRAAHIEQQTALMEPPTSESLTLHLSNFGEAPPPNSQLFNAAIVLDPPFSTDLTVDRQNVHASEESVSIDLSDVLSNSTLHAPSAVAVLSSHSNSHFSQSSCNVNDTSSNIPMYSSNLQHIDSDTNYIESSLNFTELCRNNPSLDNLSDFHLSTSTVGQLHNLISPTDVQPPQIMPESSGITSSSTSNTDLNVPVLSEEVQNLLNEDTVAASNFELNDSILRARCSSSLNAFSPSAPVAVSVPNFTDLQNVNEIAENNNNANIERELQDELGNALAAAIADRSPNDEVDENNVINENRANFDLT